MAVKQVSALAGPLANPKSGKSLAVGDRIMKKYGGDARAVEQERALARAEANNVTEQDADQAVATNWEKVLESDALEKTLDFMREHAKTGHFIEEYGEEGSFEGDFLYGMRHGRGRHVFRGQTYDGEWKWDRIEGNGERTDENQVATKGEWRNGRPHGFATVSESQSGELIYEGEFKEGKRHGLGKQYYENGDVYDGAWFEGHLHDRGVYHFANGDKFYGRWNKGVYDGVGVLHYADGSISRRVYSNGLLQSVQEYDAQKNKFGMPLTRDEMHLSTNDNAFTSFKVQAGLESGGRRGLEEVRGASWRVG